MLPFLFEIAPLRVIFGRGSLSRAFEELNTLVGFDDVQAIERRFLAKDQLARKYRDAAQ